MSSRRSFAAAFLLLSLPILGAPELAFSQNGELGDRVEIAGKVTDSFGRPVEGLEVALRASRRQFSIRRLKLENRDPIRLETTTGADGTFRLEWTSDRTYNRFDLEVGFYLRKGTEELFQLMHTADISLRIVDGGPVVAPVLLDDTRLLDDYRTFLSSIQSDDEKRVFEGAGRPDRIATTQLADSTEVKWWYFEHGRVYSFHDGILVESTEFDPVETFGGKKP